MGKSKALSTRVGFKGMAAPGGASPEPVQAKAYPEAPNRVGGLASP